MPLLSTWFSSSCGISFFNEAAVMRAATAACKLPFLSLASARPSQDGREGKQKRKRKFLPGNNSF